MTSMAERPQSCVSFAPAASSSSAASSKSANLRVLEPAFRARIASGRLLAAYS